MAAVTPLVSGHGYVYRSERTDQARNTLYYIITA